MQIVDISNGNDVIQYIINAAQLGATVVVAIALWYTIRTFGRVRKTEQIKLGEKFHSDMQHIREEISRHTDIDREDNKYWESKLELLDEITFNTLEWNAYLIRTGQIDDRRLINHFKPTFLEWHDKVFVVTVKPENRLKYNEFSELVKELKNNQYEQKK